MGREPHEAAGLALCLRFATMHPGHPDSATPRRLLPGLPYGSARDELSLGRAERVRHAPGSPSAPSPQWHHSPAPTYFGLH